MDAYRFLTPQSEITKFTSNGSGTDIVFKQNLPRMYLPPIARSVMPVDMIITREQHFDPYDHANKQGNGQLPRQHPARAGALRRQVLPHRNRVRQRAAARQRLQGVHPARRRGPRGSDPSPHQAALRRRRGVHRRLDRQAPLARIRARRAAWIRANGADTLKSDHGRPRRTADAGHDRATTGCAAATAGSCTRRGSAPRCSRRPTRWSSTSATARCR